MIGVEVRGGKDLQRISRQLRHVGNGREIRKRMTKELRASARPMVPAVRASIGAIPATSGKSSGLRRRLSRATRLRVSTVGRNAGVSVLVDPKKMPEGEKALPKNMEGLKRWRHPVFGNRDMWVQQKAHPFFFRAVRPLGSKSRRAINKVLDSITKDIT